jgi:hypothetical protein
MYALLLYVFVPVLMGECIRLYLQYLCMYACVYVYMYVFQVIVLEFCEGCLRFCMLFCGITNNAIDIAIFSTLVGCHRCGIEPSHIGASSNIRGHRRCVPSQPKCNYPHSIIFIVIPVYVCMYECMYMFACLLHVYYGITPMLTRSSTYIHTNCINTNI